MNRSLSTADRSGVPLLLAALLLWLMLAPALASTPHQPLESFPGTITASGNALVLQTAGTAHPLNIGTAVQPDWLLRAVARRAPVEVLGRVVDMQGSTWLLAYAVTVDGRTFSLRNELGLPVRDGIVPGVSLL
jgi:hypothetical protein